MAEDVEANARRLIHLVGDPGRIGEPAERLCPECGTPIFATAVTEPQVYSIRLGTARQRGELQPRKQLWTRSALGWVMQAQTISALEKK